jgi:hypothetical protein
MKLIKLYRKTPVKKGILVFLFISLLKHSLFAQELTGGDFGCSAQAWMDLRVKNAKHGIKENVEMPFVVRSTGWGCICPDYYIGISPLVAEGPWVFPITPDGFPVSDSIGHGLVVTGFFTGKITELDLRSNKDDPEEWLFKLPEFKIISWKGNNQGYNVHSPWVIKKNNINAVSTVGVFDKSKIEADIWGNFEGYRFNEYFISLADLPESKADSLEGKKIRISGDLLIVNDETGPVKSSKDGKVYEPLRMPDRKIIARPKFSPVKE